MAQIKGFAIRGMLKFVKTSGYPGGIPAILSQLSPGAAAFFKTPINSSAWYPYGVFGELLRAIDRKIGKGDLTIMPEVGRRTGQEDSGTIFKIIATIASVETIIKRSPIFWQKYCDTGVIDPIDVRPGYFRVALKNFPDIDEAQCNLILGWIDGLGRTAGAKGIAVKQSKCVHRGDPWCEYEGTWKV